MSNLNSTKSFALSSLGSLRLTSKPSESEAFGSSEGIGAQQPKKRGRPKKIIIQKPINNKIIENELILFYPIHYNPNDENLISITQPESASIPFIRDKYSYNINKILETDKTEGINTINQYDSMIITNQNDIFNIKYSELLLKCPFSTTDDNIIIEPKYTNICCMHDSCKIKGKPYFLPDKYINGTFYIIGWFCSLNCALAYNLNLKDENINQRTNLLYYLYQVNDENILPAPDKLLLKKFGGEYSIEEYRNLNKNDDYIILNNHPLICNNTFVEIIKN